MTNRRKRITKPEDLVTQREQFALERDRFALQFARLVAGVWLLSVIADSALGDAFTPPSGVQELLAMVAGWLFASHFYGGRKRAAADHQEESS